MTRVRAFTLAVLAIATVPAAAQQRGLNPRWEIPGFEFSPNGAFRKWARRVAAYRAQLLAGRQFRALNAPLATAGPAAPLPAAAAVSGTLQIPAVLFQFKGGTLPTTGRDTSDYTATLFGATPPGTNPYTVRTFYEQMSHNLLSMQGHALGYVTLDSGETYYAGAPGSCSGNPFGTKNCNGLFSSAAEVSMQSALREALRKVDSIIHPDWSQFDYDTTTGILNLVIFIQPDLDGACGGSSNNHLWSHRFSLLNSALNAYQPYVTKTPWPGHTNQYLEILDYTLQSGVGGRTACDSTGIMPIGTATHETGHAFGLPDLYDTSPSETGEGVGEWSLMGSGNYTEAYSPSRMDPWSLQQLGWITVVPVTSNGTETFGPVTAAADTAFYVRPRGSNPRGEYFLVENRQAALADTAMIRYHCQVWDVLHFPVTCAGGLMIWHIDSLQIFQHGFDQDNAVNTGTVHGVEVVQADNLKELDQGVDRGDIGDVYPGAVNNTVYGFNSAPKAVKNSDGSYVGFTIDSITQVVAGGEMSFQVQFGALVSVKGTDSVNAKIKVDGTPYALFRTPLDSGSVHTIAADSVQYRPDSSARYTFQSWSDGGAASHSVTIGANDTTFLAQLAAAFRVKDTIVGPGTITGTTTPGYFADGAGVQLTAHGTGGSIFFGWSGDTATVDSALSITVHRPYSLVANFGAPLQLADVLNKLLQHPSTLTPQEVDYLDAHGNANNPFAVDVGDFLAWVRANHIAPPAAPPAGALAVKGGRR